MPPNKKQNTKSHFFWKQPWKYGCFYYKLVIRNLHLLLSKQNGIKTTNNVPIQYVETFKKCKLNIIKRLAKF